MNDQATSEQATVKREVESVRMSDGRTVEFVGKRKLLKESIIEGDKVYVRLDYRNGETRVFEVPTMLLLKFAGHGAEQKLGDETAGVQDVEDMVLYVDELIERLSRGEWSTKREGSPFAGASILLRAVVEFSGKSVDQVKEFLKAKSPAEKMALRNSSKIKPIVERLEAEKASKAGKVDTDALLNELEG
jgi:hypothetical protein